MPITTAGAVRVSPYAERLVMDTVLAAARIHPAVHGVYVDESLSILQRQVHSVTEHNTPGRAPAKSSQNPKHDHVLQGRAPAKLFGRRGCVGPSGASVAQVLERAPWGF